MTLDSSAYMIYYKTSQEASNLFIFNDLQYNNEVSCVSGIMHIAFI